MELSLTETTYKLKDLVHESIKGSERKIKTVSKASELALIDVERDDLTTFENFPNVDISNCHLKSLASSTPFQAAEQGFLFLA